MGSFDCVVIRVANDNFAQDDRLLGLFGGTPHAGASASEHLLQLLAHILVLHEVSALRGSQAEIDGFDKARVIFQIAADHLLRQFVGVEAPLTGDLRQPGFFFGLKRHFHKHSLGRLGGGVKL
jgi:hypothetical protein